MAHFIIIQLYVQCSLWFVNKYLLLYAFFWVIPRRLNFICRRFGTLYLFYLHGRIGVEFYTYPPMKMEQTECSETSAYKIQTPGNYPEESIQHSEHDESLKSRKYVLVYSVPPPIGSSINMYRVRQKNLTIFELK